MSVFPGPAGPNENITVRRFPSPTLQCTTAEFAATVHGDAGRQTHSFRLCPLRRLGHVHSCHRAIRFQAKHSPVGTCSTTVRMRNERPSASLSLMLPCRARNNHATNPNTIESLVCPWESCLRSSAARPSHRVWRTPPSERIYFMLRQVVIDMTTLAPYQTLIRRLNRRLDELEAQLDQRSRFALRSD